MATKHEYVAYLDLFATGAHSVSIYPNPVVTRPSYSDGSCQHRVERLASSPMIMHSPNVIPD